MLCLSRFYEFPVPSKAKNLKIDPLFAQLLPILCWMCALNKTQQFYYLLLQDKICIRIIILIAPRFSCEESAEEMQKVGNL